MEILDIDLIRELIVSEHQVCISLYMPTHRSHPENLQDPIRFKNLIKQVEESLTGKYNDVRIQQILSPFENLARDNSFWNHTHTGLAVFASENLFKTVRLKDQVEELLIVADTFHTKPLRQYLQSMDNFYVLELHRDHVKLYSGNRHNLDKVEFPDDFPSTITDALGDELTDSHLTVATYNGVGSSDMFHGHGGRKDELDKDSERFFRVIAGEVYQRYSKNSDWPMILAALPEHHHLFHRVSKNPMLLEKGIPIDPSSVSHSKLALLAWEVMEPMYNNKIKELLQRYTQAQAKWRGSDDLREVAKATMEGRIDTLIVEAGKIIPQSINRVISQRDDLEEDNNKAGVDDLLDDLGEEVIQRSGTVMVLPGEHMPTNTGVAAIFRY